MELSHRERKFPSELKKRLLSYTKKAGPWPQNTRLINIPSNSRNSIGLKSPDCRPLVNYYYYLSLPQLTQ